MSELVKALLSAAWAMAERGCQRDEIARDCGIDKWTAADVIARYRAYEGDKRIGVTRHRPVEITSHRSGLTAAQSVTAPAWSQK